MLARIRVSDKASGGSVWELTGDLALEPGGLRIVSEPALIRPRGGAVHRQDRRFTFDCLGPEGHDAVCELDVQQATDDEVQKLEDHLAERV